MRFSRIERAFKFFGRSLRAGLGSSAGATSVIAKARSMNRATLIPRWSTPKLCAGR